jgi:hypothetical protein
MLSLLFFVACLPLRWVIRHSPNIRNIRNIRIKVAKKHKIPKKPPQPSALLNGGAEK